MALKENKNIVRRLYDEAINRGNLSVIDKLVAANYRYHGSQEVSGPEGLKRMITMYRTAFPDLHYTIDDQIAEADKVVNRVTYTGTHKGNLFGIAPTGKRVVITGIHMVCIADGKVVEEWENVDELGMMQQLGTIPARDMAIA